MENSYDLGNGGNYLGRSADAFRVMRELGLEITNDNIRKIVVGEIE